jgi:hypothetical protein
MDEILSHKDDKSSKNLKPACRQAGIIKINPD